MTAKGTKISVTTGMLRAKIGELQSSAAGLKGQNLIRAYRNISCMAANPHDPDFEKIFIQHQNLAGPVGVPTVSNILASALRDLEKTSVPEKKSATAPPKEPGCAELTCPHCNKTIVVSLSRG